MTGRAVALAVLLIACLGLGTIVFAELRPGEGSPVDPAAGNSGAARVSDADHPSAAFSLAPLQNFGEVTARPLFAQSRRPPPETAENGTGPISSWVLRGVIISQATRSALVEHGKPVTLTRVATGQDVEGWRVVSILPDRVVLQSGSTREELKLYNNQLHGSGGAETPQHD